MLWRPVGTFVDFCGRCLDSSIGRQGLGIIGRAIGSLIDAMNAVLTPPDTADSLQNLRTKRSDEYSWNEKYYKKVSIVYRKSPGNTQCPAAATVRDAVVHSSTVATVDDVSCILQATVQVLGVAYSLFTTAQLCV